MKGKLIGALAGALVLLTATGAWAQAGKVSGGVVKIGVLDDMSGLYSDIGGKGEVVAAEMAVAEVGGKCWRQSGRRGERHSCEEEFLHCWSPNTSLQETPRRSAISRGAR